MNSFEAMGEARLAAAEGQRVIAAMVADSVKRTAIRLLDAVLRHLPDGKSTPW